MAMADGTAPDLELGEDNPPSKPPDSDGRTAAASMELFRPGDPDHLTLKPPALVLYASFRLYAPALGLGGESILFGALSRSQIFYPSIATFACAVLNRVLWYCALAIFVTVSASLILKRHRYPESFWWEVRHPARHNLLFTPLMAVTFLLAGLPDELRVDSLNTQATIAEPTPTHWTVALWVAWGTTLVAHIAMCIWTYSRWLGSDEEFSGHTLTGRILPDTSASAHWTTPDPGFPRGYELQLTHLFTMVVWHLLSISASSLSLPASYSLPTFHVGLLYLVYLTVALFQNGGRMLTCPEVPEGFKTAQRSFLVLLMAPWAAAGSAYVAAVGTEVGEGGGMPQVRAT
ncbi:hypothetical protein M427DRAFT_399951 [Gonapodya prolifera JEL478]|uniref:Uncharacterized protein n=1 Tax=Gonapodya prolifera (strain JEL478) TaxID=1344416 RepID=A0A139AU30_GONPJ|nr:hypothetical protein M427DRAFT_399951 [Gonapodya prolifera JEL478]|eukprot:KXS20005.1 hypothetical protein M427DRAFT_399951 [Gonapodya prolifera JEL478]